MNKKVLKSIEFNKDLKKHLISFLESLEEKNIIIHIQFEKIPKIKESLIYHRFYKSSIRDKEEFLTFLEKYRFALKINEVFSIIKQYPFKKSTRGS
jgi:hypothetical protein